MKITAEYVREYAKQNDCEPLQIDGIPEGFSLIKRNMREVSSVYDYATLMCFTPLEDESKGMFYVPVIVKAGGTVEEMEEEFESAKQKLLNHYNLWQKTSLK